MIYSQEQEKQDYYDKYRKMKEKFEDNKPVFSQLTEYTNWTDIVRVGLNSITNKAEIILVNPAHYNLKFQNIFEISLKNRLDAIKEDFPEFDFDAFIIMPQPGIHFASFSYKEIEELGWNKASENGIARYYKEVMDIDTTGMSGEISGFTSLMLNAIVTGDNLGFNCLYVENEIDNWRWLYSSEEDMDKYFKPYEIYRTIEIS